MSLVQTWFNVLYLIWEREREREREERDKTLPKFIYGGRYTICCGCLCCSSSNLSKEILFGVELKWRIEVRKNGGCYVNWREEEEGWVPYKEEREEGQIVWLILFWFNGVDHPFIKALIVIFFHWSHAKDVRL